MSNQIFNSMFTKGLLYNTGITTNTPINEEITKLFILSNKTINFPLLAGLLQKIPVKDIKKIISLAFYVRNPRGGRGNRDTGRSMFQWLFINHPLLFTKNISKIPIFGRWDDIFYIFPGNLRLGNLEFVNKNYCSRITEDTLVDVRKSQNEVVKFVANKFLEFFHIFMDGGKGFELFAKWLPSEKSSFNRKYKIVETLCDELNISLKDYRVIYVSPMRKASDICETSMCLNDWGSVRYEKISKKRIRYYKNAFNRHDTKRFTKWRRKLVSNYFMRPELIVDNYFDLILENDKKNESINLEKAWQKTIKLILDNTKTEMLVLVDTNGCMYKKSKSHRLISYAISLSIISACQRQINKYNICLYRKTGFIKLILSQSLIEIISKFRLTFTEQATVKCLVDYVSDKPVKTLLYITCNGNIDVKNIVNSEQTKIIIWHITSDNINFKTLANGIFLLSGFTIEMFHYFLIHGDFNPINHITQIISAYSK